MILLAFRHGLRAAEVCDLRWEQLDFKAATLHVRRTKTGTPGPPLTGRDYGRCAGFSRMVKRARRAAKLGIKVHAVAAQVEP